MFIYGKFSKDSLVDEREYEMHILYAINIANLGIVFQNLGMSRAIIVGLWKTAFKLAKCVFVEDQEGYAKNACKKYIIIAK